MRLSLHARLLLTATLVLAAFLGLTGAALDRAFRASTEEALVERLRAQVFGLLAATEFGADGLELPAELPEPRFSQPGSGLYGAIRGANGAIAWRSRSLLGLPAVFPADLEPGEWRRTALDLAQGRTFNTLSFGVSWEVGATPHRFTVSVAEGSEVVEQQLRGFRRSLWGWLGASALVLLAVQGTILRWGLAPLRRAVRELEEMEAGERPALGSDYPRELRGLTRSINTLLNSERRRLERHRKALADLAHSLKTPLAVLRGLASGGVDAAAKATLEEQVQRMDATVQHQLQRATLPAVPVFARPVAVAAVARRLVATLEKVHADKALRFELELSPGAEFRGAEGDLMELLGNLLDNACKWGREQVRLSAVAQPAGGPDTTAGLELTVEDDGPGIAAADHQRVLARGGRADTRIPGHGIGLAVVADLAEAYGATLAIDRSPLGGARVRLRFPAPRPQPE